MSGRRRLGFAVRKGLVELLIYEEPRFFSFTFSKYVFEMMVIFVKPYSIHKISLDEQSKFAPWLRLIHVNMD